MHGVKQVYRSNSHRMTHQINKIGDVNSLATLVFNLKVLVKETKCDIFQKNYD